VGLGESKSPQMLFPTSMTHDITKRGGVSDTVSLRSQTPSNSETNGELCQPRTIQPVATSSELSVSLGLAENNTANLANMTCQQAQEWEQQAIQSGLGNQTLSAPTADVGYIQHCCDIITELYLKFQRQPCEGRRAFEARKLALQQLVRYLTTIMYTPCQIEYPTLVRPVIYRHQCLVGSMSSIETSPRSAYRSSLYFKYERPLNESEGFVEPTTLAGFLGRWINKNQFGHMFGTRRMNEIIMNNPAPDRVGTFIMITNHHELRGFVASIEFYPVIIPRAKFEYYIRKRSDKQQLRQWYIEAQGMFPMAAREFPTVTFLMQAMYIRQVENRIFVIYAPPCSGKSHYLNSMQQVMAAHNDLTFIDTNDIGQFGNNHVFQCVRWMQGIYGDHIRKIRHSPIFLPVLDGQGSSVWVPDLTEFGIEPEPGPYEFFDERSPYLKQFPDARAVDRSVFLSAHLITEDFTFLPMLSNLAINDLYAYEKKHRLGNHTNICLNYVCNRAVSWMKDLTKSGDVHKNPGPPKNGRRNWIPKENPREQTAHDAPEVIKPKPSAKPPPRSPPNVAQRTPKQDYVDEHKNRRGDKRARKRDDAEKGEDDREVGPRDQRQMNKKAAKAPPRHSSTMPPHPPQDQGQLHGQNPPGRRRPLDQGALVMERGGNPEHIVRHLIEIRKRVKLHEARKLEITPTQIIDHKRWNLEAILTSHFFGFGQFVKCESNFDRLVPAQREIRTFCYTLGSSTIRNVVGQEHHNLVLDANVYRLQVAVVLPRDNDHYETTIYFKANRLTVGQPFEPFYVGFANRVRVIGHFRTYYPRRDIEETFMATLFATQFTFVNAAKECEFTGHAVRLLLRGGQVSFSMIADFFAHAKLLKYLKIPFHVASIASPATQYTACNGLAMFIEQNAVALVATENEIQLEQALLNAAEMEMERIRQIPRVAMFQRHYQSVVAAYQSIRRPLAAPERISRLPNFYARKAIYGTVTTFERCFRIITRTVTLHSWRLPRIVLHSIVLIGAFYYGKRFFFPKGLPVMKITNSSVKKLLTQGNLTDLKLYTQQQRESFVCVFGKMMEKAFGFIPTFSIPMIPPWMKDIVNLLSNALGRPIGSAIEVVHSHQFPMDFAFLKNHTPYISTRFGRFKNWLFPPVPKAMVVDTFWKELHQTIKGVFSMLGRYQNFAKSISSHNVQRAAIFPNFLQINRILHSRFFQKSIVSVLTTSIVMWSIRSLHDDLFCRRYVLPLIPVPRPAGKYTVDAKQDCAAIHRLVATASYALNGLLPGDQIEYKIYSCFFFKRLTIITQHGRYSVNLWAGPRRVDECFTGYEGAIYKNDVTYRVVRQEEIALLHQRASRSIGHVQTVIDATLIDQLCAFLQHAMIETEIEPIVLPDKNEVAAEFGGWPFTQTLYTLSSHSCRVTNWKKAFWTFNCILAQFAFMHFKFRPFQYCACGVHAIEDHARQHPELSAMITPAVRAVIHSNAPTNDNPTLFEARLNCIRRDVENKVRVVLTPGEVNAAHWEMVQSVRVICTPSVQGRLHIMPYHDSNVVNGRCEICARDFRTRAHNCEFGQFCACGAPIVKILETEGRRYYCGICHQQTFAQQIIFAMMNGQRDFEISTRRIVSVRPFVLPSVVASKPPNLELGIAPDGTPLVSVRRVADVPQIPGYKTWCYGITFLRFVPIVTNIQQESLDSTLFARMFKSVPQPLPIGLALLEANYEEFSRRIPDYHGPLKMSTWLSHFPLTRQNEIKKALESFKDAPLNKADVVRRIFVKMEKLIKSRSDLEEGFAGRGISSVSLRAQSKLGPVIQGLAKEFKTHWGIESDIVYATGMDATKLGKMFHEWEKQGFSHIVDGDYSKFDATISEPLLKYEQRFYRKSGITSTSAFYVLKHQLRYTSEVHVGRKKVYSIKCVGRRNSGDPNTSLGNSIINAFMVHTAVKNTVDLEFKLAVCGDDVALAFQRHLLQNEIDQISNTIQSFGCELKLFQRDRLEEVCFLGGFPIRCDLGGKPSIVFVPELTRFLIKSGWAVDPQIESLSWIRGVMMGWRNLLHILPIARRVVSRSLELTEGHKVAKIRQSELPQLLISFVAGQEIPVMTRATIEGFKARYKMTAQDINEIEMMIDVSTLPCIIMHPALNAALKAD
jgi:hypothetical protein